jgi:cell filamentation protein
VESSFASDPHSERGHPCPRNFFGYTDYAALQTVETVFVLKRARQLEVHGMPGRFDSAHLQFIHRYLFQDVFPWAGEFRVVNISKGNSTFGPAIHIEAALADALAKLKGEGLLVGRTAHEFAARAAFYLGEINAIHPFREGNGRTQREFIRQLALHAEHPLSWAGFTQEQMTDASILSHTKGDSTQLAAMLEAALDSTRKSKTEG